MAQSQKHNDSYEALWKQVEKLESDALTKSALKLVNTISEKAKKEKNSPQIVKALLHTSKYAMTLEEDAQLKIVTNFKTEIAKAEFPTKNVLESYLATLYWQYFQQNRYQFYNRTKTEVKVDTVDFRTWDLTTLFQEISTHFDASLLNESDLKKTLVSTFNDVLHQQSNTEEYRPTLFDLLAHNALSFYKTSENNITRPADKFEINDPDLLCEGYAFVNENIDVADETSLQAKALCIYQKLLLLHQPSEKPYTFAEINIERLNFIHEHATFENKTTQLLEVLHNAVANEKGSLASGLYQYQIAAILKQQGDTYNPQVQNENRWKLKEALDICESVINKLPESRAHSVSQRELNKLDDIYEKDKKLAFIKKLTITKSWNTALKNENDYQSHSTEVLLPALDNGHYIILAEPKDKTNKTYSYNAIQVTNMALSETRTATHHLFQVLDRNNGKPIAGAKVNVRYQKNYNRTFLNKSFISDKLGNISIAMNKENWNDVSLSISNGKDRAYYKGYYINSRYDRNGNKTNYSCFLFTDRSIYRPGQPLYFKGIAIKSEKGISSILEKQKVKIELNDVNGQVVATEEFVTNDYGSFSGAVYFTI
ncbi:hypothetical protein GQR58_023319 [Nymphon striatum]|nr:hypothetical protein GQR58_023319 [Nymphon striatum]